MNEIDSGVVFGSHFLGVPLTGFDGAFGFLDNGVFKLPDDGPFEFPFLFFPPLFFFDFLRGLELLSPGALSGVCAPLRGLNFGLGSGLSNGTFSGCRAFSCCVAFSGCVGFSGWAVVSGTGFGDVAGFEGSFGLGSSSDFGCVLGEAGSGVKL